MSRTPIVLDDKKVRLTRVDMKRSHASKRDYEERLSHLQLQMLRVQQAYYHQQKRAVIVFEGWDASGKGGAIRRLTEQLDPRGFTVYPIGAPKAEKQNRHYLYRFWEKIPDPGRIAIFDRSWYGRVLVEKVEGFADKNAVSRAYAEINEFERMLMDDGVRVVKIFLHITPDEQLRRFEERLSNPYKHWKLTPDDIRNRKRWADYEEAIERMFERTSTKAAPWHVIGANRKWHTRTTTLEIVISALRRGVDLRVPTLSPELIAAAETQLGIGIDIKTPHVDVKGKSKDEKKNGKGKGKGEKKNAKSKDEKKNGKNGKKSEKKNEKSGKSRKDKDAKAQLPEKKPAAATRASRSAPVARSPAKASSRRARV